MAEKEWFISHILSISVILQWQVCALFLKPVKIWRRKKNNPKLCTCMSRHKRQRDVFSLKKYKLHLGRFTGILNLNMHWSLFLWKFNSSLKFVDRRIKNPKVRNFHFIFFYFSCCSVGKHLCTAGWLYSFLATNPRQKCYITIALLTNYSKFWGV